MRGKEWIIVILLVSVGLCCWTMSATWMSHPQSIKHYSVNFLQICLWTGIPVVIAGVIYLIITLKNRMK
ncbi:hypothetical protein ABMB67_002509 [Halalkalibacter oceani]